MTDRLHRTIELSGSLSGVSLALAVGVWFGVQREAVHLEHQGAAVDVATRGAVPAVLLFSTLAAISGLLLAWELYRNGEGEPTLLDGPPVTAIVPVYRDGQVLTESVGTLLDSNYENVDVAVVAEPDDHETLAVARELAEHPDVQLLINRQPGSKARAINDAVARLDADHFCVFDADERVDPDFVPVAMSHLVEADRDVFQARRVPRVTGHVETLAYLERLCFHASYKLAEPLGFRYCRSSSAAFTREAHEAVEGFDDVLTEDVDFAHACYRAGLDVTHSRSMANEMEAPHTLRDFWGQRKRWRLGHLEVCLKSLRGGYEDGGLRSRLSTLRVCTELLLSVLLVALVAELAVLLYIGEFGVALLPVLAVGAVVAPVLLGDYRDGHVEVLSPALVLAPLVYPCFGLLTIRAAFEYAFSFEGEWYRVEKTGS